MKSSLAYMVKGVVAHPLAGHKVGDVLLEAVFQSKAEAESACVVFKAGGAKQLGWSIKPIAFFECIRHAAPIADALREHAAIAAEVGRAVRS